MKSLLIRMIALTSITTWMSFPAVASQDCDVTCYQEEGSSIILQVVRAIQSSPNMSNSRKVYARVCAVTDGNGDKYFESKVQGIEVYAVRSTDQLPKIERDEEKKAFKFQRQDVVIAKKLEECSAQNR